MGIFDHRSNAGLLHEHIRDEYDHNGSDYWSDYCNGTAVYPSSNAKLYGGPLDFYATPLGRFHSNNNAVIRVYDAAGNVIETRKHAGDFVEPVTLALAIFVR